jgi:8-oxo-dGTP diphosphatase
MMTKVAAALLFENGRLLICRRSARGDFPGKWEFPGGKIEPGEDPKRALRRELEEELGILAEIAEELWRWEHQYPGRPAVLLQFFSVSQYRGALENRVFDDIRWVLPAETSRFDFLEGDQPLIQKLAAGEIRIPPTVRLVPKEN